MFGDESTTKNEIVKFIRKFVDKPNKVDKNNKAKKKAKQHAKVLVLIGDEENDTQLIRHYVLEELKQNLNLNI